MTLLFSWKWMVLRLATCCCFLFLDAHTRSVNLFLVSFSLFFESVKATVRETMRNGHSDKIIIEDPHVPHTDEFVFAHNRDDWLPSLFVIYNSQIIYLLFQVIYLARAMQRGRLTPRGWLTTTTQPTLCTYGDDTWRQINTPFLQVFFFFCLVNPPTAPPACSSFKQSWGPGQYILQISKMYMNSH